MLPPLPPRLNAYAPELQQSDRVLLPCAKVAAHASSKTPPPPPLPPTRNCPPSEVSSTQMRPPAFLRARSLAAAAWRRPPLRSRIEIAQRPPDLPPSELSQRRPPRLRFIVSTLPLPAIVQRKITSSQPPSAQHAAPLPPPPPPPPPRARPPLPSLPPHFFPPKPVRARPPILIVSHGCRPPALSPHRLSVAPPPPPRALLPPSPPPSPPQSPPPPLRRQRAQVAHPLADSQALADVLLVFADDESAEGARALVECAEYYTYPSVIHSLRHMTVSRCLSPLCLQVGAYFRSEKWQAATACLDA